MKNLVIFDWDGVITDSCASFLEYYRITVEHFGKSFPIKSVDEYRGWYDSAWENNFLKLGFTSEEVPACVKHLTRLVDYSAIPLFPGIKEIIVALAQTSTLAIASTTHSRHIRSRLESEGFDGAFSFISGGEGGTSEKQSRILRVIEELSFPVARAVMVGDTAMDVRSAQALGIKAIAVYYGWNTKELLERENPDFLLSHWQDLPSCIGRLFP